MPLSARANLSPQSVIRAFATPKGGIAGSATHVGVTATLAARRSVSRQRRASGGCERVMMVEQTCANGCAGSVMELVDLLQWPAMIVTVLAAWCVASRSAQRRRLGFWLFTGQ
jgi:nitrate reductase gamma subunit